MSQAPAERRARSLAGLLEVRGEAQVGRLLIAHSAGVGQDSTFLQRLRDGLAERGVQTLSIEFAYLQQMRREGRRRLPPRVDHVVEEMAPWCDTLSHPELPLAAAAAVIAGFIVEHA